MVKVLKTWWPGTELNRRRQPFQGCSHPLLSVDSAKLSITSLRDFVLFIGAKMEPSCKKSEPAEICLDFDKPCLKSGVVAILQTRMSTD